jgi:hypothetical protein
MHVPSFNIRINTVRVTVANYINTKPSPGATQLLISGLHT